MSSKTSDMQRFMRHYKDATGEREIDMRKVAEFASKSGWTLPSPRTAIDMLAEQFSRAARQETKRDAKTGQPYRVNHAIQQRHGNSQLTLWIDIDEAPRGPMLKSLINRREQMVGDGLQLTLDADHWNNINPEADPIEIPMDFTDDIAWRKNAPDEDEKAA